MGWSYDAAGNLLNDGTTTYSYDARNRLITQGGVTNAYNGDGVLVQRGTTRYTQDLAAPLSQILADGAPTYLYGSERLRALNGPWSVSDGLGSVRQTLNDAGTPLASAWYDPWGQPQTGNIAPFGFTGELQDAGLVYLRARWYNPGNGTFHTRDPFAGWPEQPYSLHPYAYALGNPVQWTDASGRWPQGRDSEAACVARGGTWDDSHNLCRERVPLPPPTNPVPAEPQYRVPRPAVIPGVDLPGVDMHESTTLGRTRGGSQEEDALIKAGLCTAATLSALEALEGLRDLVQPRNRSEDVPLWRAVKENELAQIVSTRSFVNPTGIEVKYFSRALGGAIQYAELARRTLDRGRLFTIVQTSIRADLLTPDMFVEVDRGISTVAIPSHLLPLLRQPEALPITVPPGGG